MWRVEEPAQRQVPEVICRGVAGAVCQDSACWILAVAIGTHYQLQIHSYRPPDPVCQLVCPPLPYPALYACHSCPHVQQVCCLQGDYGVCVDSK